MPSRHSWCKTFFDQHRLGFDSRGDLIDLVEYDDVTAEIMLVPVDNFPEVPLEVVEASGWIDVASGRWRHRNENIIVLESRALTRGIEILASTQRLFRKRCVALVDNMAAALSFERRRSRNFLVLTCIRKLAGLCLALDLSVTVRWIPSEINVSDRPSRIHDPSDIRDKSFTNLLTTVVKERSHRDEMTAQRNYRKTASMIQSQDGTSRATCPEATRKLCTNETEKSETVAARKRPERIQREPFTDIASYKVTDEKSESMQETGARKRAMRRLQQMEMRRQRKSKNVWKGQPVNEPGQLRTLAKIRPSRVPRERSVSQETGVKYKKQVEQFLSFADEEKLVLVTDDEVDAAIVLYLNMSYSQGRPVSDGEVPLAGLLSFQPQYGKLGGQKPARSWRALTGWRKRAPTRSRRPLPRMIWSGVCWEMVRNKETLMVSISWWWSWRIADLENPCNRSERTWSDQCMVRQATVHCSSTQFNEACRAKHKATTTRST